MTNLITKIEVLGKKPSQIYDFMLDLNREKYIAWHPTEHIDYRVVKETRDIIGSICFYHEKMDNLRVKYYWEVTELTKNQLIVMKAKHIISVYLILKLDETTQGTLVTHNLQIGYKNGISNLVDWVVRNFIFTKNKRNSLERHANEEFKNLEKII
jgi:hypothetical protein